MGTKRNLVEKVMIFSVGAGAGLFLNDYLINNSIFLQSFPEQAHQISAGLCAVGVGLAGLAGYVSYKELKGKNN